MAWRDFYAMFQLTYMDRYFGCAYDLESHSEQRIACDDPLLLYIVETKEL